jgi:hypothetical protein
MSTYSEVGNSSKSARVRLAAARIESMHDVHAATMIKAPEADFTILKNQEPSIYVPRRLKVGGLAAIRPGAAIVGTLQREGTVAIDVEATSYVAPTPETWSSWVAEAARRHAATENELESEENLTKLVSSQDLIEIGRFVNGCVLVDKDGRQRLQAWMQAGRTAAYLADSPGT